MTNRDINVNVDEMTRRLVKIREDLGLEKYQVILRPNKIEVDEKISIEKLFHKSGLLIDPKTQNPVFAYIRDHAYTRIEKATEPSDLKKIHFTVCSTLKDMDERDRFESRYHITNRTDDRYLIEFAGGREEWRSLYPCQNCLMKVRYKCFSYCYMSQEIKKDIVKNFNAKEAIDLLWQIFDDFKGNIQGRRLRSEYASTNYRKNWSYISHNFRKNKNFTCEECGVVLSREDHQKLTDTHHKDSNKRNNEDDNLECLCKICHSKEHSHYKPSKEDRDKIKGIKDRQDAPNWL